METALERRFQTPGVRRRQIPDAGSGAGEFEGLDRNAVPSVLLHAVIRPCIHHSNSRTAGANVEQLLRRAVGGTP